MKYLLSMTLIAAVFLIGSTYAGEYTFASTWTHTQAADEASTFFDDSYVHDLYITFDNQDWYDVLYDSHANDADDPYFEADFEYDGIVIESVGVRFKGNSSFSIPGVKKSIKIDFDEYDEDNDELAFLGLKKLNLNNNFNDPTMLREKLFLDYASNFVKGVGRAVHVNVYINGEYWGLYTAVEQIDKTFAQSRFGSNEDGNLYKGTASDDLADDPDADFGSDLTWLGDDPDLYDDFYELKTNETAYDYSQLVEFINVLNNTPTEDLAASIEPLLDVDDALAGLAINNLFANLDSYNGAAHNYYLYDRDDTGQFTHIFWDANESFGTFSQFITPGQDMAELNPFWVPVAMGPPGQTEAEERPLMENLWAVDEYSEDYLRNLAEMLRGGFDVTSATERINELASLIRNDVTADPNKQYTSAQFETNLNDDIADGGSTIYGLTSFIGDRSDYLSAQLETYATQSDLRLNELMSANVATAQDEAGDYDPWVEIYNFGSGLVDLSGLYLTDDAGDLTKWSIPSSNLDDGEFLTFWLDGEITEGSNHANFSLGTTGGTLQLTDGVTVIDSITFEAMADDTSLARVPDGDGAFVTTDQPTFGTENLASVEIVDPVEPGELYINEFMADNDATIEDPDDTGKFEDWIEIYNPGTESVDLSGIYLTDDVTDPTQWQFADGTTIAAGGYLVIWADNDTDQGDTHASFKLSADGETIALYNTDGATLIDSVEFDAQETDISYGRYPDGSETFVSMSTPTPGSANVYNTGSNVAPTADAGGPYAGLVGDTISLTAAGSSDSDGTITSYAWDLDNDGQYDDATGVTASFSATTAGTFTISVQVTDDDGATRADTATVTVTVDPVTPVVLYINEFMADNDATIEDPDETGKFEDWIELYNPGTESVDLSGMYLTDDVTDSTQWQFADGITIAAGGYLVIWADNDTDQGDTHASFKLSADGETITLYNTDGATLIDSIEFGAQSTDVSYGRYPDGTENWGSMETPTPGAANAVISVWPPAEAGRPYSGDYDGDGTDDIAVFRSSSGLWAVRNITRAYFGYSSDIPVPGDYDGDEITDIGIFRESSGLWAVKGVTRVYFGSTDDIPVPGDYDGDGSCNVGIFRESSGLWAIRGISRTYFGASGDQPVPGNYAGGDTTIPAIFRESSGLWAMQDVSRVYFGADGDGAVPGDYDGDGIWEAGIFRASAGLWAIRGVTRSYFGGSTDDPVPADYNGDGADNIGIFRASSGLWATKGITRTYFGTNGDIPVTR